MGRVGGLIDAIFSLMLHPDWFFESIAKRQSGCHFLPFLHPHNWAMLGRE